MNNMRKHTIHCLPVEQNRQAFFVGVFTIKELLTFTKYTNRIIEYFDDDGLPKYNESIQRQIEKSRTKLIADFLIEDPEATFPTNIVLHIPQSVIEEQELVDLNGVNWVRILLSERVVEGVEREKKEEGKGDIYITVIDGQHRIKGIEIAIGDLESRISALVKTRMRGGRLNPELEKEIVRFKSRLDDLKNIQLVVTFFVDKPLEYQAMLFSTINRTQKKVTESLVYELFGLTAEDSPQKSSLQIVHALNGIKISPFCMRIKLYGWNYDKSLSPPLSEATMVKSIINLICENKREEEVARFKSRTYFLDSKITDIRLPFRKYYGKNEDFKISKILMSYYSAVRETFKNADGDYLWDFKESQKTMSNVLQTTVGFQSFLLLLVEICSKTKKEEELLDKEYYFNLLKSAIGLKFYDLNRYPLTSKSKNILYFELSLSIYPSNNPTDPRRIKLNELLKELNA